MSAVRAPAARADAVRVGGRPAARHDAARHDDHARPGRRSPASFINWLEFTGTDDQTHALELEFECSLDGGPWESLRRARGDRGPDRAASTASRCARSTRRGNVDPTPARPQLHGRRRVGARHVDRLRPELRDRRRRRATFTFTGEEETGEAGLRVRVRARRRRLRAAAPSAVHGHRPDRRPARDVRARQDPDGNVDPTPDFYEWLVTRAGRHDAARHVDRRRPGRGSAVRPGRAVRLPQPTSRVEEFECSLDGGPFEGCEGVYELTGLATGSHTLRVRALDLAEPPNVDPTPGRSATGPCSACRRRGSTRRPPDPSHERERRVHVLLRPDAATA